MKKIKTKMTKKAQGFYPSHIGHGSDYSDNAQNSGIITERQKYLIDLVMSNGKKSADAPPLTSLVDFILKPSNIKSDSLVADADRKLLLSAWEKSQIKSNGGSKNLVISSEINPMQIDRLKTIGLLCGKNDNLSLTEKGRQILIKMMLDENSSLEKVSNNLNKLCKYAQTMQLNPSKNSNESSDVGIYRDYDGKWRRKKRVPVPSDTKPEDVGSNAMQPTNPNPSPSIDISAFSVEKLKSIFSSLVKAENDCFSHRNANSYKWDKIYDLNKVRELKDLILKELKNR